MGRTQKDLKERLTGHISAINTASNAAKNEYIKKIMETGKRPIIEEIEEINGTCWIHDIYTSYREYFWIKYYESNGCKLLNHFGIKTEAVCRDYESYEKSVKEGSAQYRWYLVGHTHEGVPVYDAEKMEEDGFVFESDTIVRREYYEYNKPSENITYHPIFDDEHPDYIRGSAEEY